MTQLNFAELNARLSQLDRRAELVNYIFRTQGAELRRLDEEKAAAVLGVDRKTISRYIGQLADKKIITIVRGTLPNTAQLKLNSEIIENV